MMSDCQLEELLRNLEGRIRAAIAIGEGDLVTDLMATYLEAHDETSRRFREWTERRGCQYRRLPSMARLGALAS